MKFGNWKVCKSTVGQWDDNWNWVVKCKGKVVDMFHTKQKAVEFAKVKFMFEGSKKWECIITYKVVAINS